MITPGKPIPVVTSGVVFALLLVSCETFRSTATIDGENLGERSRNGIYYFLPKARLQIHGEFAKDSSGQPTNDFLITIARLNQPDRSHRYLLEHTYSFINDDDSAFTVDEHGLIQGGTTMHSIGRSGDIIVTLGQTFLTLADAAARGAYLAGGAETAIPAIYPFTVTFDPFDAREVKEVQAQLHKCLGPSTYFEVESRYARVTDQRRNSGYTNGAAYAPQAGAGGSKQIEIPPSGTGKPLSRDGVYFHPLTTVRVTLGGYQQGSFAFHKSEEIPVPDTNAVAAFPFTRPVLVDKLVAVTFKDGEPQAVKYTYPSEALGLVMIPKRLADDLLTRLSQFTTFVGTNKPLPNTEAANRNARLADEAAAAERQATLIKNLKALRELQHPPASSPTPAPP